MRTMIRNALARVPRPMLVASLAVLALFAAGSVRLLHPVFRCHSGGIWGDSFTYVSFARQLARGHFFFDHPIAPIIKDSHTGGAVIVGPIWNTGVRDDGRIIYCVAIGYPGFLALACKLGGTWLMLHANLLLMILALLLIVLLIWEASHRSLEGLILGCIAALLLPRLDPATFNQFTYPWREPLSYCLILGAAWCVLRFRPTRRYALLVPAGLLLGLSCAVKEVNFIYGVWLGVFGLLSPGVRRERAFWLAAAGAAFAFAVGVAPLLIQNLVSSGKLFYSLQAARETANFSVAQSGTGLSFGNIPEQLKNYAIMYGGLSIFRWTPVLALIGLVAALRTTAGRFLLGALIVHLALYLQWGADFRHMFFALIPYAFFVAYGASWILSRAAGLFRPLPAAPVTLAACSVILLMAVAAPRPWKDVLAPRHSVAKFTDLAAMTKELESRMPERTLVLANRPLRDHWAVYGSRPVARLHELQEVGGLTNVYDVLEAVRGEGYNLVFIESTDRDPRNYGRIDWSIVDREWLLHRYDLVPLHVTSFAGTRKLVHLTDRTNLTVYAVGPWSNLVSSVDCAVPTGGVAFVRVNPRAAGDDLEASVDGQPLAPVADCYVPWSGTLTGATARVTFRRKSGLPVPAAPSARMIGYGETISQETSPHSDPPDAEWFPDGLRDQPPDARYRVLERPTTLRVPVRGSRDTFTVASLQTGKVPETQDVFRVELQGSRLTGPLSYFEPWIPLPPPDDSRPGWSAFRVLDVPAAGVRLYGVTLHVAHRTFTATVTRPCSILAVAGSLAPDQPGGTNRKWSVTVNGEPHASGTASPNPFRNLHRTYLVPAGDVREYRVAWSEAGLIAPFTAQTGERLVIDMSPGSVAFCESGFYAVEPGEKGLFAWTMDHALVRVPLCSRAAGYRLMLKAADGNPAADRKVTIAFGGTSREVKLDDESREYHLVFPVPPELRDMASLSMTVETWSPQKVLNIPDSRDLGFQFLGLTWEPVTDSPRPR